MAAYGQFCPVSKTAELLCQRWTILVVRELLCGSTRFGELQRGLPGCPPATLSKRLRELDSAGVVARRSSAAGPTWHLTRAGEELLPIVDGFATWGQRWSRSSYRPDDLDADFLLWDLRRYLDPAGLGADRAVVQVQTRLPEHPRGHYWIVVDDGEVDLCLVDPLHPVDAVVDADLRALTQIWMGDLDFATAIGDGRVRLTGDPGLTSRLPDWLGQHPFLAPIRPAEEGFAPS